MHDRRPFSPQFLLHDVLLYLALLVRLAAGAALCCPKGCALVFGLLSSLIFPRPTKGFDLQGEIVPSLIVHQTKGFDPIFEMPEETLPSLIAHHLISESPRVNFHGIPAKMLLVQVMPLQTLLLVQVMPLQTTFLPLSRTGRKGPRNMRKFLQKCWKIAGC